MKNILRHGIVFLICSFLLPLSLCSQWMSPNGLNGFYSLSLATLGKDIYSATFDGVLKSSDNGYTWICLNTVNVGPPFGFVVLDSLLFISSNNGIYSTSDGGVQWQFAGSGIKSNSINSFVLSDTLLFAATDSGVFLSRNRGKNWSTVSSNLSLIQSLAVFGSKVFAFSNYGTFLTTNSGSTWSKADSTISGIDKISSFASIGDTLFVSTNLLISDQDGIYRSFDNGTTWSHSNSSLPNRHVDALLSQGSNLFAGTKGGIFLSMDRGLTWKEVSSGLDSKYVLSLTASGHDIYAGTSEVVYRSTDSGSSWGPQKSRFHYNIESLATTDNKIFAASSYSIFVSTNNGTSWAEIPSGLSYTINSVFTLEKSIFIGTAGDGIYTSSDEGQNWIKVNIDLPIERVSSLFVSDKNMYAGHANGVESGVLVSSDQGVNWGLTKFNSTKQYLWTIDFAVIDTHLFAATLQHGIFHSTNNKTTWDQLTNDLPHGYTNALAVIGNNLFAATDSGLYRSTDYGMNWSNKSSGMSYPYVCALFVYGTNLFAGTLHKIYLSSDNGENWVDVSYGFPYSVVTSFGVSDGYLICGAGSSFWRRPLSEMITPTSVQNTTEHPKNVRIESNFPNPFSATTTLSYEVASNGYITMRILDVAGVTIETVLSNMFVGEGKHDVTLDGSHLPSGTYFVEMVFKDASGNLSREIQPVTVRR